MTPPLSQRAEPRACKGKVVLITGGTGSFGKRFIDRLLREHEPAAVRVYSRDELKQSRDAAALRRRRRGCAT